MSDSEGEKGAREDGAELAIRDEDRRAEIGGARRLGDMWFEEPPEVLSGLIHALCGPDEAVIGLLEGEPRGSEYAHAYLLVTSARVCALLTRSGSAPVARDLAHESLSLKKAKIGRDVILLSLIHI